MSIFPLLQPESPEAQAMYDLFITVVLISLGIFIIVTGLIAIALWRGRSSQAVPEQEFGSSKREIFEKIVYCGIKILQKIAKMIPEKHQKVTLLFLFISMTRRNDT